MASSARKVPDQNGRPSHPDGAPVVVVFKSEVPKDDSPGVLMWKKPIIGSLQDTSEDTVHAKPRKKQDSSGPFKFINKSCSKRVDKLPDRISRPHESLKPIQKSGKHRDSRSVFSDSQPSSSDLQFIFDSPLSSASSNDYQNGTKRTALSIPRYPYVYLDPFTKYPVPMKAGMYRLLHKYLSILSDATVCGANPSSQGWLPMAMDDPALFHAILWGAVLHGDLLAGRSGSREQLKHMNETVSLLNKRLQEDDPQISDSTIVTVAHLADFEAMVGNYNHWNLHMDGLLRMTKVRGGFPILNDGIKNKILRADIDGCIGSLSKPRFTADDLLSYSSVPLLPEMPLVSFCDGLRRLLGACTFDVDFIVILGHIQYLTSILNNPTLDLPTTDKVITSAQYELLLFHETERKHLGDINVQEACYIGALIYLKIVYYFTLVLQVGTFPAGAAPAQLTVNRLKYCLESIDVGEESTQAVVLWLLFLGGVVMAGNTDRAWFVAKIVQMSTRLGISNWEGVRLSLVDFLWVDKIHNVFFKNLWDEVEITMNVLHNTKS